MEPLIYLDNDFIAPSHAKISVFDLSIARGYGVSEYLRTYDRYPFRLLDHLLRFKNSATEVGIPFAKTIDELTAIVQEAINRVSFEDVGIKFILTGGPSEDGYFPSGKPHLILIASPFVPYPKHLYKKGAILDTITCCRRFPSAKTTEYLPALVAMQRSKKDCTDVLFVDGKGAILEAGFSNFFAFKQGTLITPASHILPGITRKVILEIAKEHFPIETRTIQQEEIPSFDAAFITSSNKEVMPIVQISHHKIGTGVVPDATRWLMKTFHNQVLKECQSNKTQHSKSC
ncbi:MAG: aminotransferase class IV [Chlamydiota bacterium]